MTDNKRIKECKRKIIAAINEAKLPFAVTELILETVLNAVRENMVAEEAAAQQKEEEARATAAVAKSSQQE